MNRIKRICFIGVYCALIISIQTMLSGINGIEFTTFLFSVIAIFLPISSGLFLVFTYTLIEGLLFGFGDWVLIYLIYWSYVILSTKTFKIQCKRNTLILAIINSINAFLIGVFFAGWNFVLYDFSTAISYYINGLSGDILHLIFNFIITLFLFPIISNIFSKVSYFKNI